MEKYIEFNSILIFVIPLLTKYLSKLLNFEWKGSSKEKLTIDRLFRVQDWKLKPRNWQTCDLIMDFCQFYFLQRKQPSKRSEIKPKSKFDCLKLHIFDQICRLIYISRQSNFGTVFTKNEQQQKEACAQTSNFWPRSWAVLETAFFDAQVFFLSFLTNRNLKEAIVSIF